MREGKLSRVSTARALLQALLPGLIVAGAAGQGAEPRAAPVLPVLHAEVTRGDIEAHVRFLASDELAGRSTGSPEAARAAAYLADVLKSCGVEPAGDEGTFFQAVPLHVEDAKAPPEFTLVARTQAGGTETIQAVHWRDYDFPAVPIYAKSMAVVVVKSADGIPKDNDWSLALFVDAFETDAKAWFEASGHPAGQGFGMWIKPGSKSAGEERAFVAGLRGEPKRDAPAATKPPAIRVRGPLLERIRNGEIQRLSLRSHVEERKLQACNVVGRIAGAGLPGAPEIAKEAVVLSAHYDHLPPRAAPSGDGAEKQDRIYNGADDDASGCAAVLELAGALAQGPKPARTVVFLLATGEEVGLLGTLAYLDHPVVPLAATVANLNVEMIGRPDPMVGGAGRAWLTGFDETDLGRACAEAGLPIVADPRPAEHFYERSDNYAFVLRHVIGQTFSTYNMHTDYHHVSDEADKLDYGHMEGCTQAILRAARLVVDGKLRPQWSKADGAKPR